MISGSFWAGLLGQACTSLLWMSVACAKLFGFTSKGNEGSLPHTDIKPALSQTPHWSRVSRETLAMRKRSPNNATCGESPATIRRPPGVRLEDYQLEPLDWAPGRGRGHGSKHQTAWSPRPVASCKWLLRGRYQTLKSCTQSRSWRVLNSNKETVILQ